MYELTDFVVRHLLESTLCGGILACLALIVPRGACRHTIWFAAAAKFAVPTVLLASLGAQLASFHPAASWMIRWLVKLTALLQALPGNFETIAFRSSSVVWQIVWAAGVLVTLIYWRLRVRQETTVCEAPSGYERELFERARKRMQCKAQVQLSISLDDATPALRGVARPMLMIPRHLSAALNQEELEAVFSHELAHARRRDNLTAVIVQCLACLFWFHPLLGLAGRQMRVEREYACDDLVVASGANACAYANGLWKICRLQLLEPTLDGSAMSGTALKNRFHRLLTPGTRRRILYASPIFLFALASLITAVPVAGGYCSQCVSNGAAQTCESESGKKRDRKGDRRDEMDCRNRLLRDRQRHRSGR